MALAYRPRALIAMVMWLAGAAFAACDAQVGPTYQGEPLVVVHGSATLPPGIRPPPMAAYLVWQNRLTHRDAPGLVTLLDDGFPARFDLALIAPPAASALNDLTFGGRYPDETQIGLGIVAALPTDFDFAPDADHALEAGGVDAAYVLAWVARDVRPGTFCEALLGAPLERGFHLLRVIPAATYNVGHPAAGACDTAGAATCGSPATNATASDWTTYSACVHDARRAAGCLWPSSAHDRLVPAESGFAAPIAITLAPDLTTVHVPDPF